MITQPSVRWFDVEVTLRTMTLTEAANLQTTMEANAVKKLLDEARHVYEIERVKHSNDENGQYPPQYTAKDRLAMCSENLQEPSKLFHIRENLEELSGMLNTKNTNYHGFVCGTVKELLLSDTFLPRARRMKLFTQQPLHQLPSSQGVDRQRALLYWYIEDIVKKSFSNLLDAIEADIQVTQLVEGRRLNGLRLLGDILHSLPEEQGRVCGIIVNKMGDPNVQISNRCISILLEFIQRHSGQQRVVVTELENLLFRPNVDMKTQTLAIHILNQVVFNHHDSKLPSKAISIYFALFKKFVANAEVERRIMNGIMVGIKRAVPYVTKFEDLEGHFDTLFTMASASSSFHHRVASLNLLNIIIEQNVSSANVQLIVNRFYRSLYLLMLFDPTSMPYSTHLTLYFSLLYKALRKVHDLALLTAFAHRLLQTSLTNSPPYACASLMLLGELSKANPSLKSFLARK
eukprot:PhF_6_TR5683/c0_g1_i2/m.8379/K14832/MAK21, NOC1, CEBPZ; ribosome biogenesis protein MAK21